MRTVRGLPHLFPDRAPSLTCYQLRCRCDDCRALASASARASRERLAVTWSEGDGHVAPGAPSPLGYERGCRCPDCRAAKAGRMRAWWAQASQSSHDIRGENKRAWLGQRPEWAKASAARRVAVVTACTRLFRARWPVEYQAMLDARPADMPTAEARVSYTRGNGLIRVTCRNLVRERLPDVYAGIVADVAARHPLPPPGT